jgi:16S rRNA (cytosine967-C5)-methyltransferase
VNGQNPRQIAAGVLRRRQTGGGFTEHLLENALAEARLSPADRALCQELVYGVVRRQATLDWLIARKTAGREQKPALQNLLRLGLYQIFWLDKIPPHAAVHETVELAKRSGFGPRAGFVNAVLRGCLREFDETKKILAELKTSDPAIGFSHPQWLVEKWQKRFGDDRARHLLEWNNTPPKTFARVNGLKFGGASVPESRLARTLAPPNDAGALLEKWRNENVEYDFVCRDWLAENLVFQLKSHPPLNSLASFRDGWFYVQDPGTLLAVTELNPLPGETILDLCAAPGGKTTFIAQLMNNEGKIIAGDVAEERLKLVQENCQRLGVTCVEYCRSRGDEALTSKLKTSQRLLTSSPANQPFDRILVDAPCSNTGVLRRRVDLRWRISPAEISRLQQTQLNLLRLAAPQLKPGGILIYSTCSLEPEENQEVVEEFLRGHKHFKLESERELLPFADQVDGAFVARLKKTA